MRALVVFICLGAFLSFAQNKKAVQIEGARFRPVQIAIPDAFSDEQSNAAIQSVVASVKEDLELSTVFNILNPKSFVADRKKEEADFMNTEVSAWINVGAEGLVKVKAAQKGKFTEIAVRMFQIGLSKSSAGKYYQLKTGDERMVAHRIADDIFEYFTGEKIPFDSRIVAVKQVARNKKLVQMDMDGENEKTLSADQDTVVVPIIAPDGSAVLYSTYDQKKSILMEMDLSSAQTKRLSTYPGMNIGAVISPDKKHLALTLTKDGDGDIYLMDRNGGNLKRLTTSFGIDTSPSFSPDGKKIAFVSSRSGNPHIYLMNVDGSDQKRLTFQGKYNQTPRFSPKGDRIIFTGRDENFIFDIYSIDVASGKITRLTQDQGRNEDPWFSPNGRLIAFTSTRDGARDIYVTNLDGSVQKRITKGGYYWTPSWGPKP